jgi:PEP-CTERM motif
MKRNFWQIRTWGLSATRAFAISLALMVLPHAASATPILQVNGSGILTGALNVDVGGTFYDLQFVDGTCASVFSVCDQSHFTFTNQSDATLASQALLDQVFVDIGSYLFDSDPYTTYGCTDPTVCYAYTPYDVFIPTVGSPDFISIIATNRPPSLFDYVQGPNFETQSYDTSLSPISVFAVWSVSSSIPSSVPEPPTVFLLGAGLLALFSVRWRPIGNV